MNFKLPKRIALSYTLFWVVMHIHAQNPQINCQQNIKKGLAFFQSSKFILKDEAQAITLITPCAEAGDAHAQYILGMLYKTAQEGLKNETKAFTYMQKAAKQNHPKAACELGVLYKDGIGCTLNFNTAINWFEKAESLGNAKGSYSIGYMYFKGLGSITQDYSKAITWFRKSDYPMAKHWLGICNYFGYGMPVNKDKAIALWVNNPIPNSLIIANHLEAHQDLLNLGTQKNNTAKATEFGAEQINEVISNDTSTLITENNTLTQHTLKGNWHGKLIELDWAKQRMNRSFPVQLAFEKNTHTNNLDYTFTINQKTTRNVGNTIAQNYHFKGLTFELPRLYQDDTLKYQLNYKAFSLDNIEVKEINKVRYLIAELTAQVTDWEEPGAPMLLVLGNTKALTNNGQEIDEALLDELAKQKGDSFITLYPNPFKTDLLIQYELDKASNTTVSIQSLSGLFTKTIINNVTQQPGDYLYHYNGSNLPVGVYVVQVHTHQTLYTKLVIKE